jgi:hypothetical protein
MMAKFREPRSTGNELMIAHGYAVAAVAGAVMIAAGAALALNGTPEPPFVWTGAIALLAGSSGIGS